MLEAHQERIDQIEAALGNGNGHPISADEARAAIEAERRERVELCRGELAGVLAKHRCTLDVAMLIRPKAVVPQVSIVAQD